VLGPGDRLHQRQTHQLPKQPEHEVRCSIADVWRTDVGNRQTERLRGAQRERDVGKQAQGVQLLASRDEALVECVWGCEIAQLAQQNPTVHSLEQRVAETIDREQTLKVGILLQTLVDAVGEALYFLLGVRPLPAPSPTLLSMKCFRRSSAKLLVFVSRSCSSLSKIARNSPKFSALTPFWSNSFMILSML
jgi:hypothetical protein